MIVKNYEKIQMILFRISYEMTCLKINYIFVIWNFVTPLPYYFSRDYKFTRNQQTYGKYYEKYMKYINVNSFIPLYTDFINEVLQ